MSPVIRIIAQASELGVDCRGQRGSRETREEADRGKVQASALAQ